MSTATIRPSDIAPSDSFQRRWLGELPIYVIGLALLAVCLSLLASRGVSLSLGGVIENARLFAMFTLILVAFDAAWQLNRNRPDSPTAFLKARYSNAALIKKVISGLPFLAIAIVVLPFFSKMKAAIPLFNDYTWDAPFIAWDQAIFFGYDAWQVFQPVLGYPI
ncbi:MAG: hypothetical protein AAGK01_08755, partial [Pseudomonadota bacterium]